MHLDDKKALANILNLLNADDVDYTHILMVVKSAVSPKNAPFVLGIVAGIQGRKVKIEEEKKANFISLMSEIKVKLEQLLPTKLKHLIPSSNINFSDQSVKKLERKSILKAFEQIIIETLVKKSKHEIWNSLNVHFNRNSVCQFKLKDGLIRHLFRYLTTSTRINKNYNGNISAESIKILKEMSFLMNESNIDVTFEFFGENPQYFGSFLIILKACRTEIYEKMQKIIYSEKKYFKESFVCSLPDIDFNKIVPFVKDYNWDVTENLLRYRPAIVKDFIDAFNRDELGISRRFFLDVLCKQDEIFSNFIPDLGLASEELVEICTKSYSFTKKYFYHIETEDQMLQFCKILSKKDEAKILAFLKEIECLSTFELFLKTLLKTTRLTGELKNYIVAKYSDSVTFFHSLISYLEIETIEPLLGKYYERNTTIECLLRKFYPQELIIEIHKFKDPMLAFNLISDCAENHRFENKDWVLAMKSLENVYSAIKSSTSLLILRTKPSIRAQTMNFLKKSVCDAMWKSQMAVQDFIKCLEFLKEDCFAIFDSMTREEIIFVMQKSRQLENTVRTFFKNRSGSLPPNLVFVWNCLRML